MIPSPAQATQRLEQILRRGSVNLGGGPDVERLMLMLTRSCEMRCGYCFVDKQENAPTLSLADACRGIDLLMASARSRLELQFFGGEPTRQWDVLLGAIAHAHSHSRRQGRSLEIVLTTNGMGLDPARLSALLPYPVMLLFSLDGDELAHRRYRPAHNRSDETTYGRISETLALLRNSTVPWFMNAVLPPAAADEVMDRYRWAKEQGVPRLQLNYAVGMRWTEAQMGAYIGGLLAVLRDHHQDPGDLVLFNWRSDCEPVMLSDDLIVDVDGSVLHDGAIFLERRFAKLKETYQRGHLNALTDFDPLRWSLAEIYEVMVGTYPAGSEERAIVEENCRFGAAVDLAIQALRKELGLR